MTMFFGKINNRNYKHIFQWLSKKESWYILIITSFFTVYFVDQSFFFSSKKLNKEVVAMDSYNESLSLNLEKPITDTLVSIREKKKLLYQIENRIGQFLYEIPDYSYIQALETYLRYKPQLLDEIPSCVPLIKGEYDLSSKYGYRIHPISKEKKKHWGLDFAAPKNKHVYATASGTVISITHSKVGYGSHIIIKHRFGYQTLYGHLTKILVIKGQSVTQHELIGTVGNTGASDGNHLHYEIIKNGVKIDPRPSLNLKKTIIEKLID